MYSGGLGMGPIIDVSQNSDPPFLFRVSSLNDANTEDEEFDIVKILGGITPLNVALFFDLDANSFMEELLDAEESDMRPLKTGK